MARQGKGSKVMKKKKKLKKDLLLQKFTWFEGEHGQISREKQSSDGCQIQRNHIQHRKPWSYKQLEDGRISVKHLKFLPCFYSYPGLSLLMLRIVDAVLDNNAA